jgi:plastocyanin domain-containing protein
MGFITKIGLCFRDSSVDFVKSQLKGVEGWDSFLMTVNKQENIENSILGGRIRYRHLTADEVASYLTFDKSETMPKPEEFFSINYWGLPVDDFDESL